MNVVQGDWTGELLPRVEHPSAYIRLSLLESDLHSLRISYEDYLAAKNAVDVAISAIINNKEETDTKLQRKVAWSRMFHHAKVFIVCMRRFARLLEAAKTHKHEYPQDVGEVIKLTWRKNKFFFDRYREARNAIEHIDGEVKGHNTRYMNFENDCFEVVVGARADITLSALETVESAWAEIVKEILRPAEERVRIVLIKRLLVILQARVEHLSNL